MTDELKPISELTYEDAKRISIRKWEYLSHHPLPYGFKYSQMMESSYRDFGYEEGNTCALCDFFYEPWPEGDLNDHQDLLDVCNGCPLFDEESFVSS